MRAGDGRLHGDGHVGFREGRPDALDLHLAFEDFQAVRLPAYEAAVDGTLDVGGTLTAPRIQGTLDVERAVVRPAMLPSAGPDLEPDPTIRVVGLPAGPVAPSPVEEPPLSEAVALDVTLRVERNAWIRRPDAQIELAGHLRVTKEPGAPPRIAGTVRLVRGWYAFQGRRFDIDEGAIVFSGQSPPDPSFEVRASHRSGEYRVLIVIGGSATKPTLDLTSDPPLEQADVLSVLLFGKPASQLGQGESLDLQRQAVSLASGYLMPELQVSVMESLGLDTFELGSEGLRAGRYVTQDVFLSVASEFGQEPSQSVSVEYALTRRLSLKATTATNGESAIDLQLHHRY